MGDRPHVLAALAVASRLEQLVEVAHGRRVLRRQIEQLHEVVAAEADDVSAFPLATITAALFPRLAEAEAVTKLRAVRYEINLLASSAGIDIAFAVDGHKRAPAEARTAWFEGRIDMDELVRDANTLPQARNPSLPNLAVLDSMARPQLRLGDEGRVRIWVVFDRADEKEADELAARVTEVVRASELPDGVEVSWAMRPSAGMDRARWAALQRRSCSAVIVAVSPALLGGPSGGADLADLVGQVPVLPVLVDAIGPRPRLGVLQPLASDGFLPPLGAPQDRLEARPLRLRTAAQRRALADQVAESLIEWITEDVAARGDADTWDLDENPPIAREGTSGPLTGRSVVTDSSSANGEDVQIVLDRWVRNPAATPYLVLLGEYGMGKTVSTQVFARRLSDARAAGLTDLPRCFYFDLRAIGGGPPESRRLDAILETLLEARWHAGAGRTPPAPEVVIHAVQREGAVVIFDGLDEVLVHLDPHSGRALLRELLSILPPAIIDQDADEGEAGRVIITCRTHFFRSVGEQHSYFTGEDRDGLRTDRHRRSLYTAVHLLPFTPDQVKDFLHLRLGDDSVAVADAYAHIHRIHDLEDLSRRPYTLELIVRAIGRVEAVLQLDREVDAASLYGHVIEEWLDRDSGKHTFPRQHKLRLMADLAAHMTEQAMRQIEVDALDEWLARQVREEGPVADWFQTFVGGSDLVRRKEALGLIAEDLRTATFIVRPGEEHFAFAHSSMLEYFLARYLVTGITEGDVSTWALEGVSDETLAFVGQLAGQSAEDGFVAGLTALKGSYAPRASELALRYALLAEGCGYPAPSLRGFDLAGADLRGLELVVDDRPGDLSGSSLAGADLRDTVIRRFVLRDVDLRHADLGRATLDRCQLVRTRIEGATLAGTSFHRCDLVGLDATMSRVHGVDLVHCRERDVSWPASAVRLRRAPDRGVDPAHARAVEAFHHGPVRCVARSPVDGHIASGGVDGYLRAWDGPTGDLLWVRRAHQGTIRALAWSPDGHLASCGDDGAVRLWDAASGEASRLDVDAGPVRGTPMCLAWAPDAALVVGRRQGGVVVAEPSTGHLLWSDPDASFRSAAWSADGRLALDRDGILRVVDGRDGRRLWVRDEAEGTRALAWSPDGRLAATRADGSVRVYDGATGELDWSRRPSAKWTLSLAWTRSGALVASGDHGAVAAFDGRTGDLLWTVSLGDGWVRSIAASTHDDLVAFGEDSGSVGALVAGSGEVEWRTRRKRPAAVRAVGWADDATLLTSHGTSVRRWHHDGRRVAPDAEPADRVAVRAISTSAGRVAVVGGEGVIRVQDAGGGALWEVVRGHRGGVVAATWWAGDLVTAGIDGSVRRWDGSSGELDWTISLGGPPTSIVASDAELLAVGTGRAQVRLVRADGTLLPKAAGQDRGAATLSVVWLDGGRLLTGHDDGAVSLWTSPWWKPSWTIRAHHGAVTAVARLPGGRFATGGSDGALRVWTPGGSLVWAAADAARGMVHAVACSPGGRLATGGDDGQISVREADGTALWIGRADAEGRWWTMSPEGLVLDRSPLAGSGLRYQLAGEGPGGLGTRPVQTFDPPDPDPDPES